MYQLIPSHYPAPIRAWTEGVPVEPDALTQLRNAASLPFVVGIAVMPDVHIGIGATVGSVIVTRKAIVPAAVGVDIGCGMNWTQTNLKAEDLPSDLKPLREAIEKNVPLGFDTWVFDALHLRSCPRNVRDAWKELAGEYEWLAETHPLALSRNNQNQIGTLGGGEPLHRGCN